MMKKIQSENFERVRPLFAELASFNGSLDAVLAGTAPGTIYVDSVEQPTLGFAATPEGHYLAGEPVSGVNYEFLKSIILSQSYLIFTAKAWEERINEISMDTAMRKHERQYLRFQSQRLPHWRQLVPEGFKLTRIDQKLLDQTTLKNHEAIVDWVRHWHSPYYFLKHGFGYCLIEGENIASWSITDCVNGDKCEIGITTDMAYRKRGLAAIVVAAMVDYASARGIHQIGWHCLQSNRGSIAVAEKVGFAKVRGYFAYSSSLPSESANDMTRAEYEDWAQHYERFVEDGVGNNFRAAQAWALAGNVERAMMHLRQFVDRSGAKLQPQWVDGNWTLETLRGMAEFEALIERGE